MFFFVFVFVLDPKCTVPNKKRRECLWRHCFLRHSHRRMLASVASKWASLFKDEKTFISSMMETATGADLVFIPERHGSTYFAYKYFAESVGYSDWAITQGHDCHYVCICLQQDRNGDWYVATGYPTYAIGYRL